MAHDVFISYSTDNEADAGKICDAVESAGYKCWMAPRDLDAGVSFPVAIIQAIKKSRAFVVIVSSSSVRSEHVSSEINAAFNHKIPILGYRTDHVRPSEEMEYFLGTKNWVNAHAGEDSGNLKKLVNGVTERIGKSKAGRGGKRAFVESELFAQPIQQVQAYKRSWLIYFAAIAVSLTTFFILPDGLDEVAGANKWIRYFLVLAPLIAILPEVIPQVQFRKRRKQMHEQGKSISVRDPEYFKIYPLDTIPEYMDEFRADQAHVKVLNWIMDSPQPLMYLTGRSGTGKSSILNAYVSPKLETGEVPGRAIHVRSYGNPMLALARELAGITGEIVEKSPDVPEIRSMLKKSVLELYGGKMVIIFDQFEELLIIHERAPDRMKKMGEFLDSIIDDPIENLVILLTLRTDYLPMLEELNLPSLKHRDNWFEVGAFTESHARKFLKGANIDWSDQSLNALFEQISGFEGTRGLIRPIILNMVGLIISKSSNLTQAVSKKLNENLLVEYLRHYVFRRDLKDHAPKILEVMISDAGTKIPRAIEYLSSITAIPSSEVRGTLNLLGNEGMVRCIDEWDEIWEIAHDFIAHHLLIVLRNTGKPPVELALRWAIPIGLAIWILFMLFFLPPTIAGIQEKAILSSVENAGGRIEMSVYGIVRAEFDHPNGVQNLNFALKHLSGVGSLRSLTIRDIDLSSECLESISKMASLEEVVLPGCGLRNGHLGYFSDLVNVELYDFSNNELTLKNVGGKTTAVNMVYLNMSNNQIQDEGLEHIDEAVWLEELDLSMNHISDDGLSRLKNLTALKSLNLRWNQIEGDGLRYLDGMENLETLILNVNQINDAGVTHLQGLTNLRVLNLSMNQITDNSLGYLSGMGSLKSLNLSLNQINGSGLINFSNLDELSTLDISSNEITDESLAGIGEIKSLNTLYIMWNELSGEGLANLNGMSRLNELYIDYSMDEENVAQLQEQLPNLKIQYF